MGDRRGAAGAAMGDPDIAPHYTRPYTRPDYVLTGVNGVRAHARPPVPSRYYSPDFRGLQKECAYLHGRVQELEWQGVSTMAELNQKQAAVISVTAEAHAASEVSARSQTEADRYRAEITSLTARLHAAQLENQRRADETASLRAVATRLTTERLAQSAEMRRLRDERDELEARWRDRAKAADAAEGELQRSRRDGDELRSMIDETEEALRQRGAVLEAEREDLRILFSEHTSLQETLIDQQRVLDAAAATRDAMSAQLQREASEVRAAIDRAGAAESACLAEKSTRVEADAKAALLAEQLRAYQDRCAWMQQRLDEAHDAARGAAARERMCESESSQMALRMGLFQRIVAVLS